MHPDQSNAIANRGNKGDFVAMLSRKPVYDARGKRRLGKIAENFEKFWKVRIMFYYRSTNKFIFIRLVYYNAPFSSFNVQFNVNMNVMSI